MTVFQDYLDGFHDNRLNLVFDDSVDKLVRKVVPQLLVGRPDLGQRLAGGWPSRLVVRAVDFGRNLETEKNLKRCIFGSGTDSRYIVQSKNLILK